MPIVVEVTAVSYGSGRTRYSRPQNQIVERAMVNAVDECRRKGVTDPAAISAAMSAAREEAKRLFARK